MINMFIPTKSITSVLGWIALLSKLIIIRVFSVETVYCLCLDEMYITLVFEIFSIIYITPRKNILKVSSK